VGLQLYPFQQAAVDKFTKPDAYITNVIIGDDMGLGKTVTAITLDKTRRGADLRPEWISWLKGGRPSYRKMTLVVTLKSTIGMWVEHFKEWAPELKVVSIDTTNRWPFVEAILKQKYDVYVCHWEALRFEEKIRYARWFHVVADECQRMKNPKTQVTRGMLNLRTLFKTAMSGTWADNKPQDAWQILNWLYPSKWRSMTKFIEHHVIFKHHNVGHCQAQGCDKNHRTAYKEVVGVHDAELIQRQISPFYIRRRKEDVLPDLPDKYYTRLGVHLHPKQRRAYDDMRRKMLAWVGDHEGEPIAAPVVLSQLVRLQQFAVAYGKVVAVKRRVKDPETGHYFDKIVETLALTEPSAKLDACMDIIEQLGPEDSIVFFSQSKQVMYMFAERLEKAKVSYAMLTGDTSQGARDRIVKEFQAGQRRVFIGTIAAGGVGITLTRASTVVFLDRTWSPSANRQAEDRLHRIGQRSAVQVIDLVAEDTVDAGRLQKLELKWSWIREILGDPDPKGEQG
jgi:SNF2 family DNA or RNA helicase